MHPPFVDYDLKSSNFYTDYCKFLKFIEYWEQNGECLSSSIRMVKEAWLRLGFQTTLIKSYFDSWRQRTDRP